MRYLFFDLDGTLVNSSEGIINCFQLTFLDLNIELPDLETLKTFIGPPLETTFSQFGDAEFTQKAMSTYRQYYHDKGIKQVTLYPGIMELLKGLSLTDCQLYIATSKNQPMAIQMLTDLGIHHYFKGIYGALEKSYTKAEVLQRALDENDIVLHQAVMIGDTAFDMIGGQQVGLKTLGVTWGFGSEISLLESGAGSICHSPEEIKNILEKI